MNDLSSWYCRFLVTSSSSIQTHSANYYKFREQLPPDSSRWWLVAAPTLQGPMEAAYFQQDLRVRGKIYLLLGARLAAIRRLTLMSRKLSKRWRAFLLTRPRSIWSRRASAARSAGERAGLAAHASSVVWIHILKDIKESPNYPGSRKSAKRQPVVPNCSSELRE